MNILLWVLQTLLAAHTVMGAIWKLSNSEQVVPSLIAIPHSIWLGLCVLEIFCAVGLVLPVFMKRLAKLAPLSALVIVAEMLLFAVVNLASEKANVQEITYWVIVALFSGFIAFGRLVLEPRK